MIPFKEFFTDPVLQASTIGSMLMCLASSLVGVIIFIRKRSLAGEAISHATYPGIALSAPLFATFFAGYSSFFPFIVLGGAFISGLFGMKCISYMEEKLQVKSDAALCFVLSLFFGIGILFASRLQFSFPMLFQQVQVFLYGQAATMLSFHVWLYLGLALIVMFFTFILFNQIKVINFDRTFAEVRGLPIKLVETLTTLLLVLAVVVGLRSVGVVLMAGMLIAPAVAARQCTNKLSHMFFWAGFFGLLSGFLGNVISVNYGLPTGPVILLVAGSTALLFLFCGPKSGLIARGYKSQRYRFKCLTENTLKAMLKKAEPMSVVEMRRYTSWSIAGLLALQGWIIKEDRYYYRLSEKGEKRAKKIVRLHRLWELYLFNQLGFGLKEVHRNAEEMEHLITPELELELMALLDNPKRDPHDQIIPERES